MSRTFANFSLFHEISQQFRLWLSFTEVPDESYFQTLSRIQRIETVHSDYKVTLDTKNYDENEMYLPGLCPRFSNMANRLQNYSCTGIFVRSLCHLSFQDLKDFCNLKNELSPRLTRIQHRRFRRPEQYLLFSLNFLGNMFLTLVKSLLSRKYWRGFCVIDLRVRRMLPEVSSYLS